MKHIFYTLIIISVLSSGCINSEASNSSKEKSLYDATSNIEKSNYKLSYNNTNIDNGEIRSNSQTTYLVESGKLRMIKSDNRRQYLPPQNEDSNFTIRCENKCTILESSRKLFSGPELRPKSKKAVIVRDEKIDGSTCEKYVVSDPENIYDHYRGIFWRAEYNVTHCIKEDDGLIHETSVSTDDEYSSYKSKSRLIQEKVISDKRINEEVNPPEVVLDGSGGDCDQYEFRILSTGDLKNVKIAVLDPVGSDNAESLEELDRIKSISIQIEESWKVSTSNISIEQNKFILAPLIDDKLSEEGITACLL